MLCGSRGSLLGNVQATACEYSRGVPLQVGRKLLKDVADGVVGLPLGQTRLQLAKEAAVQGEQLLAVGEDGGHNVGGKYLQWWQQCGS